MADIADETSVRKQLAGKIARVDAALATPWWRPQLADRLDTHFALATATADVTHFKFWLLMLACAQAFGFLRDASFGMQESGLLLRGFLVLPVLFGAVFALDARVRWLKVSWITSAAVMTSIAAQIGLAVVAAQPIADRYLMGTTFAFSILHILVPFTYRQIVVHSLLVAVALGVMSWISKANGDVLAHDMLEVVLPAMIAVSAVGALVMRHNRRRGFLMDLRSALQADALEDANRSLARLLRQDTLTGVYNRRYFDETMHRLWHETEAAGRPLGLILLDVDRFKSFNDRQGHQAGDQCLKQVATCLSASLRESDFVVARYGGEEFAVVLPGVSAVDAYGIGERLRKAVEHLAWAHPAGGSVTVSVGTAACVPDAGRSYFALVDAADSALYASKEAGRNCVTASFIAGEREKQFSSAAARAA